MQNLGGLLVCAFALFADAAALAQSAPTPALQGTWTQVGPTAIAGNTHTLAINPLNTQLMWAGSDSGGMFTSFNGGATWYAVPAIPATAEVTSIRVAPSNPSVIYAATGCGGSNTGLGIFKSTDGGSTWTDLTSMLNSSISTTANCITSIAIDPNNENNILEAAFSITHNAIKKSSDGGMSWTTSIADYMTLGQIDDFFHIAFDPNNSMNAITGTRMGTVLHSGDGGSTWQESTVTPYQANTGATFVVTVAYAKSSSSLVYALVDAGTGLMFRSTDGGNTWTGISNSGVGGSSFYLASMWVDPVNAQHLVVGGIDTYASNDGGQTFSTIITRTDWSTNFPYMEYNTWEIVGDPDYDGVTNKRVYDVNTAGIFVAPDITAIPGINSPATAWAAGWQPLNNGLVDTEFVSGRAVSDGTLVGVVTGQQAIVLSLTNPQGTTVVGGNSVAIDPLDHTVYVGSIEDGDIFSVQNGNLSPVCSQAPCTQYRSAGPLVLDPNDSNRLYAAWSAVTVTADVKDPLPVWTQLNVPLSGSFVTSLVVARGNSNVVYVADYGGNLYETSQATSGSPSWTQSAPFSGGFARSLTLDPASYGTLYAIVGNPGANAPLQISTNSGRSWGGIAGNLPSQLDITVFARHPTNSQWMYVGTTTGLYASSDAGSTWYAANAGPVSLPIADLQWVYGTLIVFTGSRGIYSFNAGTPPNVVAPQTGYWYNPAESGRGFTIEQNATTGNVFVATYLYSASGNPLWYAAGPAPMTGNTFSAPLVAFDNGQSLNGSWQSAGVGQSPGNISIAFSDGADATLTWPGGTIPIQRFSFANNGLGSGPTPTQPQTGYWYNPAEPGRGYTIEVQDNTLFLAAYMYDSNGNAVWYASGPATLTANATFQGQLTEFSGGQTLTGAYRAPTGAANAGNITLQFSSDTAGKLTLPDGKQIPIQRFNF